MTTLALISALGITACSDAQSREQIDLNQFTKDHDKNWPYLNAVDATSSECNKSGCIQAVKSDYVTVLKFPSVKDAAQFAAKCDCHAIDPLVIRFDGKHMSDETRKEIINTLSNINAGSPD